MCLFSFAGCGATSKHTEKNGQSSAEYDEEKNGQSSAEYDEEKNGQSSAEYDEEKNGQSSVEYDIEKVFHNQKFSDVICGKTIPVEIKFGVGGEAGYIQYSTNDPEMIREYTEAFKEIQIKEEITSQEDRIVIFDGIEDYTFVFEDGTEICVSTYLSTYVNDSDIEYVLGNNEKLRQLNARICGCWEKTVENFLKEFQVKDEYVKDLRLEEILVKMNMWKIYVWKNFKWKKNPWKKKFWRLPLEGCTFARRTFERLISKRLISERLCNHIREAHQRFPGTNNILLNLWSYKSNRKKSNRKNCIW